MEEGKIKSKGNIKSLSVELCLHISSKDPS